MPELSELKARIKTWERAFKADHQREPTKEDVKGDANGIAKAYAAYKTAMKNGGLVSGFTLGPGSGSGSSSRMGAGMSASSGSSAKVKTMAPPAIASSSKLAKMASSSKVTSTAASSISSASTSSRATSVNSSTSSTSSTLKRKASTTEILKTPTKPRIQSRPPSSPSNPFLSIGPGKDSMNPQSSSKYLYAASPQKLKAALSSASVGLTPRTRARKRLRGEDVGETPVKDRVGRRSWSTARGASSAFSDEDEEEEDEILGPSPARPNKGKSFKPLFEAELRDLGGAGGGKGDDLPFGGVSGSASKMGQGLQRKPSTSFFARAKASVAAKATPAPESEAEVEVEDERLKEESRSRSRSRSGSFSPAASPSFSLQEPGPDEDLGLAAGLALEGEEADKEAPEPARIKRITVQTDFESGQETELVIRPTRDIGRWRPLRTPSPAPDDDDQEIEVNVPPGLLDTLSLRSPLPATSQRRVDRKVEAIFRGSAKKKEVDIGKLAEELVGDDDDDDEKGLGDGEEGDDDWESEVEGWKVGGPGEVLSDDGW